MPQAGRPERPRPERVRPDPGSHVHSLLPRARPQPLSWGPLGAPTHGFSQTARSWRPVGAMRAGCSQRPLRTGPVCNSCRVHGPVLTYLHVCYSPSVSLVPVVLGAGLRPWAQPVITPGHIRPVFPFWLDMTWCPLPPLPASVQGWGLLLRRLPWGRVVWAVRGAVLGPLTTMWP